MELPKSTKANKTGRNGLNILTKIVEKELGWIVRQNHQENDFGIDAFIDIILDDYITGKSIAIQIKSGNSYFKSFDKDYWIFTGRRKHLNYYLNHDGPVLIVLVDIESNQAYWEVCKIEYISLEDNSWSMPIPKKQRISSIEKEELLKYVSPTVDYIAQFEEYWKLNKLLSDSGRLFIFAAKDDILNINYQPLIVLIGRLCSNKLHISKFKENIDIAVHGYDDDKRELFEIPEVKKWIMNIFQNIPGLSYFLANDQHAQFLRLFIISNVNLIEAKADKKESKIWVEYDTKDLKNVFEIIFSDLNEFTDYFGISEDTNKQISENISKYIVGAKLE